MHLFIIFSLFFSLKLNAITNESFKNIEKYNMLKINPINMNKDFTVSAVFYPPEGKKLNQASFIKIWKRIGKNWEVLDEISPKAEFNISSEYKLIKTIMPNDKKSDLALEVEFIHCTHSGGQCAMEKFLGKIPRTKSSNEDQIKLTLRAD